MRTFFNEEREIFVNIPMGDVTTPLKMMELEAKIAKWLEEKHHDVWLEIEFFSGGRVDIGENTISLWGDNGVCTFNTFEIEEL